MEKPEYTINITFLDEDANEYITESKVKNISEKDQCEIHRTFLSSLLKKDIRSGKELWLRREELFPNLEFCSDVKPQLYTLKGNSIKLQPIISRLFDLQRVASTKKSSVASTDFNFKTTPESESRTNRLSERLIFRCPDGERRLFSWHSRYTPGAGRIHFYQIENKNLFYIGYIGEKIE